jgi:hypothetical protein
MHTMALVTPTRSSEPRKKPVAALIMKMRAFCVKKNGLNQE